ncbi:MAG TPA: ATP-dependent DNA helicase RecQ [Ktedonobacteraceae bacterium]
MFKRWNNRRRLRRITRDKMHFDALRPGQETAIQALLEGHDTLAVMPTGSGKSFIYQAAALLIAGPTVIISPLIALQMDQVEAIEDQSMGEVALLNSTLSAAEWEEAFAVLKGGKLEFLFLTPEQLSNQETLQRVREAKPALFVVDEAHCISEWGHDFRPGYARLGAIIEALGHPRVLALTATASQPVRDEIVERLGMHKPSIVVQGFDRPNLWLGVEKFYDEGDKKRALTERIAQAEKPGIVYVGTRKHAEELAEHLRTQNRTAVAYHAGMKAKERVKAQTAFMQDEIEVIVATTAFGMGVNKGNVRFVYHYEISDSVDAYYQEIGRAGRDGAQAKVILFYNSKDLGLRSFLTSSGKVAVDEVEMVARVVHEHGGISDPRVLKEELDISQTRLTQVLSYLEELEVVQILFDGKVKPYKKPANLNAIANEAVRFHENRRQVVRSRLAMMQGYAEVASCRRKYLLNYFGEELDKPCGFCDICESGLTAAESTSMPFPVNSRVTHTSWGQGLVMRYEEDKVVVLFDDVGYKTLSIEIVTTNGLLTAVHA